MPGFFPPQYQTFDFRTGDVFADLENGRYGLMRILTIDRFDMARGDAITIAGQSFTATDDDYLLVIGCALGEPQYQSVSAAKEALAQGHWVPGIAHAPMRATCITPAQQFLVNIPVRDDELAGYRLWRKDFEAGTAGIF